MSVSFRIEGSDNRSVKVAPTQYMDQHPVTVTVQTSDRNYEAYLTCAQARVLGQALESIASLLERE